MFYSSWCKALIFFRSSQLLLPATAPVLVPIRIDRWDVGHKCEEREATVADASAEAGNYPGWFIAVAGVPDCQEAIRKVSE